MAIIEEVLDGDHSPRSYEKKLNGEEYNALSEEERKAYDEVQAKREKAEQEALPYRWKQTLQDVDITIEVPKGTKAKMVDVVMKKQSLRVALKTDPSKPLMDDKLSNEIKLEDSTWMLEDNQYLQIHLEKVNQMTWWKHVLVSDPEIDTTKITPENSKLSDLDGETRGMVEKMMFDQQQKQMGKPTSEERQKMDMFKKFQAQHPEMDFSNAKMM